MTTQINTVYRLGCAMLLLGSSAVTYSKPITQKVYQRAAVLLDFSAPSSAQSSGLEPEQAFPVTEVMDQFIAGPDRADQPQLAPVAATPSPTTDLRVPAWMLLGRASAQAGRSMSFTACGAAYRPTGTLAAVAEARRRLIYPLVAEAACAVGLPVGLMDALVIQESQYNPLAISPRGAIGLAQLMAGTARHLGANPYDMRGNLLGGARYLRQQMDEFGAPHLALAAYNAGPGRVRQARGIPAIAETRTYVSRVLTNWSNVSGLSTPALALWPARVPVARSNPFRRAALESFQAGVRFE